MKDMNWPERVAYLENQLADSDRDNQRLREFIEGLPDYDALAQLVCDLWHPSAAAHIPPGLQKRVRDAAYAQLTEEQRFLHGAAADAQQVPEGMALYKGEFVTARMVVERLAEAERLLLVARDCLRTAHNGWADTLGREIDAFFGSAVSASGCNHFPGQVNCEWCTEPERATQPVEPKP